MRSSFWKKWQSYSYYVVLVQRLTSHDRHTLTNITSKSYLLAFALPFFPLQVSPVGSSPLNGIADHWTFLTLWISFGACLFCIFDFFLYFCIFSHSWIPCRTHLSQPVWPLPKVWLTLDWERSPIKWSSSKGSLVECPVPINREAMERKNFWAWVQWLAYIESESLWSVKFWPQG